MTSNHFCREDKHDTNHMATFPVLFGVASDVLSTVGISYEESRV